MKKNEITWEGKSLIEMSAREVKSAKLKLKEAWESGLPDKMVLTYTGLSQETIDEIKRCDPEYARLQDESCQMLNAVARVNIAKAMKEGSTSISKWYLERTDESFQKNTPIAGAAVVVSVEDKADAMREMLEGLHGTTEEASKPEED